MVRSFVQSELVVVAALAALAPHQVSAQAPEPTTTVMDTLGGVVRDMTTGGAISGVRVLLATNEADTIWERAPSHLRAITDEGGEFVLPRVPQGSYMLRLEYSSYPTQVDTVEVGGTAGWYRIFPLRFSGSCLGFCLPSPALVAANRARQKDWKCQVEDHEAIEEMRHLWMEELAQRERPDWDSLLTTQGVNRPGFSGDSVT